MAAVAGALIQELLSVLQSVAGKELTDLSKNFVDAHQRIASLTNTMELMKASITVAQKRMVGIDSFREEDPMYLWLDKMKACLENIDDVLDEWTTHIAVLARMDQRETCLGCCCCQLVSICLKESDRRKASKWLYDLCPLFPCCSKIDMLKRLSLGQRVKVLTAELETINKERQLYEVRIACDPLDPFKQLTMQMDGNLMDFTRVKGRADEKEVVVNMLLNEAAPAGNIEVISLLGLGGIGKTTIARMAFADPQVIGHFNEDRFWISLSYSYGKDLVTRVMKYISGSEARSIDMNDALSQISQNIQGRRFLLVFDNVWSGDENELHQLLDALRFGLPGSKILVTSRNWTTGHLGVDNCKIFPVPELPAEDCWAIFRDATIQKWSYADHQHEGLLRDRVLGLCNGLPFIAEELRSKVCDRLVTNRLGSIDILDMTFWTQYEKGVAHFGRLWLDYNRMSEDTRRCLSFCATFPPNSVLDKKELIDLWMAQGLLQESGQVKDKAANDHFLSLASQSIFKDVEEREGLFGRKHTFKIHQLVHQFASFIGKEESVCQIVVNPDPGEGQTSSKLPLQRSRKVRHLRLVISGTEFPDVSLMEELRSLVVQVNDPSPGDLLNPATLSNLLMHLRRLRSLAVSNCGVQNIPKIVSDLIHLRLLNVSRNRNLTVLPEEICSLYNLETLNVDWCTELVNLPKGMGQLVNLTNFYNYMTRAYLPQGVKQLSKLRRLSMFTVGDDGQEGMTSLDDLKACLGKIDGFLCINQFRRARDLGKVRELMFQSNIKCLEIRFGEKGDREVDDAMLSHDENLLRDLNPYRALDGLRINGYYGSATPEWFQLFGSLKSIILCDCPRWVELPVLGSMENLELVELRGMEGVTVLDMRFLGATVAVDGAFPALKKLVFVAMKAWVRWTEDALDAAVANKVMPRLGELEIAACNRLLGIPERIRQQIQVGRIAASGSFFA